jgi:hypothetical protein
MFELIKTIQLQTVTVVVWRRLRAPQKQLIILVVNDRGAARLRGPSSFVGVFVGDDVSKGYMF